jgi:hypothetical protein
MLRRSRSSGAGTRRSPTERPNVGGLVTGAPAEPFGERDLAGNVRGGLPACPHAGKEHGAEMTWSTLPFGMILTGTDPTGHMLAPEPDAHLTVGGVAGEVVVAVLERSIADGKGDIDFERIEAGGTAAEGGG